MYVNKTVMVQQTLGWFGAYSKNDKRSVIWQRLYWHGGRADNSNKTTNNAKYSNCKGLNHETWRKPTKFAIAAISNFISTSNFISIYSPSIYKLSMIRLVRKVHFGVAF